MLHKDLISRARQSKLGRSIADIVSRIDRDKQKPGFQLVPGGFRGGVERVRTAFRQDPQQFNLFAPRTLARISQRAGQTRFAQTLTTRTRAIARTPLTQRQQRVADVPIGFLSGVGKGVGAFTGADEFLREKVLQPAGFSTLRPQTTAGKVAEFGGGVVGFALGPGKFFRPLETKVARKVAPLLLKPFGVTGAKIGGVVAAEAVTASLISPLSVIFQKRKIPEAFIDELIAGLTGRAVFGLAGKVLTGVIKPIADKFNVRISKPEMNKIIKETEKAKKLFRGKGGRFTGEPLAVEPSRRLIETQPTPDRPLGGFQLSARTRLQPKTIKTQNIFGQEVEVPVGQAGFARLGGEPQPTRIKTQGIETRPQVKTLAETTDIRGKKEVVEAITKSNTRQRVTNKTPLSLKDTISQLPQMTSDNALKHKVTFIDFFRTPTEVLDKIGLKKQSTQIRQAHQKFVLRLPKEIGKITEWSERVGATPEASQRVFQALDGQKVRLTTEEKGVVKEIRVYLSNWADELGLPKDKRIANYITHIFEDNFITKEFDPELEKIISDKIPGSVYNPFLQKRLGKQGYVEDAFRVLDAYAKRATRKVNMDPALASLKEASVDLPLQSWNFVKKFTDKVNLRPTDLDNLVDAFIKQTPIGGRLGQRPTARVTRKVRNATYRATLGLNVGSALRNLTQGANTYAVLGEKYTARGYFDVTKELLGKGDELQRVGVLADGFIQDRTISSQKRLLEKLDRGLWFMFDMAEKINRGSAYFGAKARALDTGKSLDEAIQEGIDVARKTQFTFGAVDTPVILQGDVAKTLLQFQSFNIKQVEFLGDLIKEKNVTGMIRYMAAWAIFATVGKNVLGFEFQDALPFSSEILEGKTRIGKTPIIQTVTGLLKTAVKAPGRFGEPAKIGLIERLQQQGVLQSLGATVIPAFVQAKKTIEGIRTARQGFSESRSGRLRTPVEQTGGNLIKGALLGQFSFKEVRDYFDSEESVLGEKQTETFKKILDQKGMIDAKSYYDSILDTRDVKRQIKVIKETGKVEGVDVDKITTKQAVDLIKAEIEAGLDVSETELYTAFLNKPLSMPATNRFEKSLKDSKLFSSLNTIETNETLSDTQKQVLKQKIADTLNRPVQDLETYQVAKQNTDTKTLFVLDQIDTFTTGDEMMRFLIQGRKPVNGKLIISDGVITNLVDDGILSAQFGKELKRLDINEDGSLKRKRAKIKTGRAKVSARSKATKRFLTSIGRIGLPQAPRIRTQGAKVGDIAGITLTG